MLAFFRFLSRRFLGGSIIESSDNSKFCTVPPIFAPKIVKKQDGMLAFFWFPSSAKNGDFRCLEGTFRHLLAPWSTILPSWGAQGAPRKTPGGPDLDFSGDGKHPTG